MILQNLQGYLYSFNTNEILKSHGSMSNKNIATFLQMFMILVRNSAFDNKVEEEILEQKRWCLDTTKTLHVNWLDNKQI